MTVAADQVAARIVACVDAVLRGGQPHERALRTALRGLDAAARATVKHRALSTIVLSRRLAFLAAQAGLDDAPAHLVAVHARVLEGLSVDDAAAAGTLDDDDRLLLTAVDPARAPWPADPVLRLAVQGSLPDWIAAGFVRDYGLPQARELVDAGNRPGPVVLRANVARIQRDALAERLAGEGVHTQPTSMSPWGLRVVGRANLFGLATWREGLFEVQDEASQLVALAVDPGGDDVVVDLCAGRGGKALALAPRCARVVCCDVDARALADLAVRVRRAQVHNVVVVADASPGADAVLVDAPCSSLGTLRRSPDRRWRDTEVQADAWPAVQRALLRRAVALCRPGGRVVYATCTLRRAENEDVVDAVLQDGLVTAAPLRVGPRPDAPSTTLTPHEHGTDGFFIAALRRAPIDVVSPAGRD